MANEIVKKCVRAVNSLFGYSYVDPRFKGIESLTQSAIDESQPPVAEDANELVSKCWDTFCQLRNGDYPNNTECAATALVEIATFISVFLTAHDKAKDAEIERLESVLKMRNLCFFCGNDDEGTLRSDLYMYSTSNCCVKCNRPVCSDCATFVGDDNIFYYCPQCSPERSRR